MNDMNPPAGWEHLNKDEGPLGSLELWRFQHPDPNFTTPTPLHFEVTAGGVFLDGEGFVPADGIQWLNYRSSRLLNRQEVGK